MNNQVLFLIIVCLCAIIPAGVCFVAVWARQMADGRRLERALDALEAVKNIEHSYERMQSLYYEQEKRVTSLAESFQNLTNKINSRQKVEQNAIRRAEREQIQNDEEQTRVPQPDEMENLMRKYPGAFAPPPPNDGGRTAAPKKMIIRPKLY